MPPEVQHSSRETQMRIGFKGMFSETSNIMLTCISISQKIRETGPSSASQIRAPFMKCPHNIRHHELSEALLYPRLVPDL